MGKAPSHRASLGILITGGLLLAIGSLLCVVGLSHAYGVAAQLGRGTTAVLDQQLATSRTVTGVGIILFIIGLFVGSFGLAALLVDARDDQ